MIKNLPHLSIIHPFFNWNPRGRIQRNPSEESGAREITVEKLRKKLS